MSSMEDSSTRQLINNDDLETGIHAQPSYNSFSPDFVTETSNNQRALSTPLSLVTGTGYHIYETLILPHISSATREVILVTCFWAPSATLTAIHSTLIKLSQKALACEPPIKISVRICLSTYSLARNMLLPTPKGGQAYGPKKWKKLGLPQEEEIPGLDLKVTRNFDWPFGIMHSKFVVIDRDTAILPSCNVSWERWLEAAVSIQGPVVEHLLKFYASFWLNGDNLPLLPAAAAATASSIGTAAPKPTLTIQPVPTTLLPSPHTPTLLPPHLQAQNMISSCPSMPCLPSTTKSDVPTYPPTPLLTTTTHLLSTARHSIILLTPNVTSPTVLYHLHAALARNVNVTIYTNRNLMTAEQLVTAGTTTPRCLDALEREAGSLSGRLVVHYFDADVDVDVDVDVNNNTTDDHHHHQYQHPLTTGTGTRNAHALSQQRTTPHSPATTKEQKDQQKRETTPIKLHAKITILDNSRILLGSGNMDAASWGTSQELGLLIEADEVVGSFWDALLKRKEGGREGG